MAGSPGSKDSDAGRSSSAPGSSFTVGEGSFASETEVSVRNKKNSQHFYALPAMFFSKKNGAHHSALADQEVRLPDRQENDSDKMRSSLKYNLETVEKEKRETSC